jgi:hypothetical protein
MISPPAQTIGFLLAILLLVIHLIILGEVKLKKGTSRLVVLIFGVVIKFPRVYKKYKGHRQKMFITGLLGNLNERLWYKNGNKSLFPKLYFVAPFGLFAIHQRVEELTEEEWKTFQFYPRFENCPKDLKPSNFGKIGDKIVMIDYGS